MAERYREMTRRQALSVMFSKAPPATDIVAASSGYFAQSDKEKGLIIGRLVQASMADRFTEQLCKEYCDLKEQGGISEEYDRSEESADRFNIVFDTILSEPIDRTRLAAIKNAFLNLATGKGAADQILNDELLRIVTALSAVEIQLTSALWRIYHCGTPDQPFMENMAFYTWSLRVSEFSSIDANIVYLAFEKLEARGLVDRNMRPRNTVNASDFPVLSSLGIKVCEILLA